MSIKKTAAHHGVDLLEEIIENFINNTNLDDIVRMEFMEQSAKYLGVYVENNSTYLLENRTIH